MNNAATIFNDGEAVELLRDRPDLLAIADAVRATQRRTGARRRGWMLLVAAAVVASAAAVVALAGGGAHTVTGVTTTVAVGDRFDPVPVSQAVSEATREFGAPVILPRAPFLDWSGPTALGSENWSGSAYPGRPEHLQQIWVQSQGPPFVSIGYAPATDQEPTYSPALIQVAHTNSVQFRLGTLSVGIFTTGDVATLKALAQSILDQAATAGG